MVARQQHSYLNREDRFRLTADDNGIEKKLGWEGREAAVDYTRFSNILLSTGMMMAVLRLFILLTVLLMHLDHCGGQKDPPQRFEARTRERDKRRAAEKEKRRAERRGEEAPQKQEKTPNPKSNSNVQDGQANKEPEAPVKKNQASTIDLHNPHTNTHTPNIHDTPNIHLGD